MRDARFRAMPRDTAGCVVLVIPSCTMSVGVRTPASLLTKITRPHSRRAIRGV